MHGTSLYVDRLNSLYHDSDVGGFRRIIEEGLI